MPELSSPWIPFREFREVLSLSRLRFSELKAAYPRMRGYLVVSSATGQAEVTHGFETMLRGFSRLFRDGGEKDAALGQIRNLERLRKNTEREPIHEAEGALREMSDAMEVDGAGQIEIRFDHLDYSLIGALRGDPRIDQGLTPQTRASIRIVLGNISGLAGCAQDALKLNSNNS